MTKMLRWWNIDQNSSELFRKSEWTEVFAGRTNPVKNIIYQSAKFHSFQRPNWGSSNHRDILLGKCSRWISLLLSVIVYHNFVSESSTHCIDGSRGGGRKGRALSPPSQNFFIFMQFSERNGQIVGWCTPLGNPGSTTALNIEKEF